MVLYARRMCQDLAQSRANGRSHQIDANCLVGLDACVTAGECNETRKSMSLLATRLSHLVLKQPVSDPMSGFFMLHRDVLDASVHQLSGLYTLAKKNRT